MTSLADPPRTEGVVPDWTPSAAEVREERAATVSVFSARLAALGVMFFAATLPLQWQTLAYIPGVGTLRYFHIGAVVMVLVGRPSPARVLAVVRRARPIPEGLVALLLVLSLTAIGYRSGVSEYVQMATYVLLGLLGAACTITALSQRAGRMILAYSSIVASVTFSFFFYHSMVQAGVDPETTITRAVISGDPTVIEYSLFRASFNGAASTAGDVRSNTRHEIFAALVVIFCLSLAAGAAIRSARIVLVLSGVLTLAFVIISQSRSNLLAVGIALALYLIRLIVYRHIRAGTIGLAVVVIVGTTLVFPSVIRLLVNRVSNTTSYDARLNAWNLGSSEIMRRIAFGGPDLVVSTHTMFGDALLRGGVMGAIGAVVVILGFLKIALTELRLFYRTNRVEYFTTITIMSIVIVRSFTAGGGRLHLTEWFGLGVVLALQVTRLGRLGPDYMRKRASVDVARADELTAGGTTDSPSAPPVPAGGRTSPVRRDRPVRSAR